MSKNRINEIKPIKNFSFIKVNHYKTLTLSKEKYNTYRHYPPLDQEWKDNVCGYDKEFIKNSTARNLIANKLVRGYFNITFTKPITRKAKRTRNLIRIKSSPRFFVTEPDIKQTGDKAIFTVYVYMRESISQLKKFFNVTRSLSLYCSKTFKNALRSYNPLITYSQKVHQAFNDNKKERQKEKLNLKKNLGKILSRTRQKLRAKNILKKSLKETVPYTRIISEIQYKRRKSKPFINNSLTSSHYIFAWISWIILFRAKLDAFNEIFNHIFYKWILSLFKLQLRVLKINAKNSIIKLQLNKIVKVINLNKNTKKKKKIKRNKKNLKFKLKTISTIIIRNKYKSNKYKKINQFLEIVVKNCLNNLFKIKSDKQCNLYISHLQRCFDKKFKEKLKNAFLEKETSTLKNLSVSFINKLKFNKLTPLLKTYLNSIFNKKIELNLVNLKYPFLNSEIKIKTIVARLINQKTNVRRILSKHINSSRVAKMSYNSDFLKKHQTRNKQLLYRLDLCNNYDTTELLSLFKSDYSETIFNNFSKQLSTRSNTDMKKLSKKYKGDNNKEIIKQIEKVYSENNLDAIKYKWITGIRLEARGRLSNMYGASRARSYLKYKGSLKNLDNLLSFRKKLPSSLILRNQNTTNLQYAYKSSERHIGTFGVKGWLSSN